jgi:hypothetical protein
MKQKRLWQRCTTAVFLLSTTVLAGCGGTSNPNALGQTQNQSVRSVDTLPDGNTHAEGQSGRLGIFLSATPEGKATAKSSRLWVNILKVELIDIQEKPVTVFESQDGNSVDLSTLHESSGRRFAVLTSVAVPSGKAYIRARITFSKSFSQFAVDTPTGQILPLSDTVARDDRENPILSFPLTRPRDLGNGQENLVIDFDLGKMLVADGRITPAVREGDQNGLNDLARQIPVVFVGTLQELTGKEPSEKDNTAGSAGTKETPIESAATEKSGTSVPDTENAKNLTDTKKAAVTEIITDSAKSIAKATDKRPVDALDTLLKQTDKPLPLPETTVAVAPDAPATTQTQESSPAPSSTTVSGRLFTLSLGTNRSVTIQAGEATVYDNDGAGSNPMLTEGKKAAVRGILDPVTKRILAQRVTLLSGDGPTVETTTVYGSITGIDTKNNLLTLNTTQTEGMMPAFAAITVQMVADAVYRSRGGLLLTADEFSAALAAQPGALVAVSGTYEPVTGTIRGRTIRLEENTPNAAHEAKIVGIPQAVETESKTFSLTSLTLWQGIAARPEGVSIPVVSTAATAYRDETGQYLSSVTFFKEMKAGRPAQAVGLYANGKLTATRLDLMPVEKKAPETKATDNTVPDKPTLPEGKAPLSPETDGKNKETAPTPPPTQPD